VLLLAVATGAIAAVAMTFANYLLALTGWSPSLALPVAGAAVVLLTAVNIAGVAPGAYTQNVFTVLKLAGITALVVVALRPGEAPLPVAPPVPVATGSVLAVLGMALSPILFSYGGWQQTNYIAEEIRDPERTLPRALVLGVIIVVAVYLLANVAYLRALGIDGLAASTAPAAEAMERVFGAGGRRLISLVVLVSTFGFLDLVILVSPRVYQAMAADGLFPAALARLHPRTRTPVIALVAQCGWALTLVSLGSYGELLDWVVFADWLTFGGVAATLLVYRRRPEGTTYRAPLYPVSVLLFIGAAIYVIAGSVASNPQNAVRGTLLLASGIPVYLFWRSRGRRETAA
jgi:APA family basic amino acid/polyamine antiporter